jgi:hypothetical protein
MARPRHRLSKERAFFPITIDDELAIGIDLEGFRTRFGRYMAEPAVRLMREGHPEEARRVLAEARDIEVTLREAYPPGSRDHDDVFYTEAS